VLLLLPPLLPGAGLEFAGVVLDAAEAAEGGSGGEATQHAATYKRGDRVLGVLRFGAFASHITIPAGYLRPVPPGWSFEQAAAYPVQTLTAAYGLYEAGGWSGRGGAVLVHSAAGGVGLQALQILTR
jgi:alcohol dehydrogenase